MPFKKIFFIVLLFFATALFCCTQTTHNTTEKKYTLALHIHPGAKCNYTIISRTATNFKVNDKEIENINASDISFTYEAMSDTGGGSIIKITYNSFHIVSKKGETTTELNSDNAANSINPAERMLSGLKGSVVLVSLNSKGEIVAINGFKEMADKMSAGAGIANAAERDQLQQQLNSMLGEGFIKSNLGQSLHLFPDSAVYIGDSWTKQQPDVSGLEMNYTLTYTLADVKDSIAEIQSKSEISHNGTISGVFGAPVNASFTGNEKGVLKTDINTGMLLYQKSNTSIEGTIDVNANKVPLSIEITRTVNGKKI